MTKKELFMGRLKDFLREKGDLIRVSGEYLHYKSPVTATCTICSHEWSILPHHLKQDYGCPKCSPRPCRFITSEEIQTQLNSNNRNIVITSIRTRETPQVSCLCTICSYEWNATPSALLNGRKTGCPSCAGKVKGSKKKLSDLFFNFGHNVDVVGEYVNNYTPIRCLCNECNGFFYPLPSTVIYGSGCPDCAYRGGTPKGPAYLYYIRIQHENTLYWKIGITTKSVVESRFPNQERPKITLLYKFLFEDGRAAKNAEKNILRMFRQYKLRGNKILLTGNSEIFTADVLQLNHLVPVS